MTKAKLVLGSVLGAAALICSGVAVAQKPVENISGKNPNLAAAQRLSQQAWEKITTAQQANEWDMQGHAAKAKELLGPGQPGTKAFGRSRQQESQVSQDSSLPGNLADASVPATRRDGRLLAAGAAGQKDPSFLYIGISCISPLAVACYLTHSFFAGGGGKCRTRRFA